MLVATLSCEDGISPAEAFYFPLGLPNALEGEMGLRADLAPLGAHPPEQPPQGRRPHGQRYELRIHSRRFAQCVHVDMPGFIADDQYFHMAPNSTRTLTLRARAPSGAAAMQTAAPPPHATLYALNAAAPCRVTVSS